MTLDDLRMAPFNLSDDDIAWVRRTRDSLSMRQGLQQLFVLGQLADDPAGAHQRMAHRPGGVHRKWGPDLDLAWQTTRVALEEAQIPPFITGDMEGGGYGATCATPLPNALATAAIADDTLVHEVARVMAEETAVMGFNWSFSPAIDIAARLDSGIVGTRSFGSDLATIRKQGLIHALAMQRAGVAATAKHWPGEGFDNRDQHLVTTVNPLSWQQWQENFGGLYRELINAGVMTVMAGHIAWPAGAQHLNPAVGRRAWAPATVSGELCIDLLRGELGFKGLVVSDATSMGGLSSWDSRTRFLPEVLQAGCDVILFSKSPDADLACLEAALLDGRLTEARVDDALTRVLGLKAALGLHRKSLDERLAPLDQVREQLALPGNQLIGQRAAQASVTLVKDTGVLPISPARHKRVVLCTEGIKTHLHGATPGPLSAITDGLRQAGFVLSDYDADNPPAPDNADLVLYLLAQESMMCAPRSQVDWSGLQGGPRQGMRRTWHDVPTVMVSFGQPACLLDAPRVPAYINAYYAAQTVQEAVLHKLLGHEPFIGVSPIDAFCGQEEARW